MKVEKSFKKPLARQIREGVEIEMSRASLLNSKSEWNNLGIPRIIVEEGELQREDKESGLGNQTEIERQRKRKERAAESSERNKKRKQEKEKPNVEPEVEKESYKRRKIVESEENIKISRERGRGHRRGPLLYKTGGTVCT